ncbi:MAG: ABC-F family ATP-binding cassette domain-containing protein [Thermoplasmata archaeon]|nr:ABC-F family ATP-binding cassette domain-containing protein [Thermoplasmata archaeon]
MLLRAEGVSRSFGPNDVLRSASIQVDSGDRIALVGRNGVGKTTFIKILMGQLKADTGDIRLRTDRIGYLPQFPNIDRTWTVSRTVGTPYGRLSNLSGRISDIEKQMARSDGDTDWTTLGEEYSRLQEEFRTSGGHEVSSRSVEAIEKVGLGESFFDRPIGELSGGEYTKVMLARVLVQAEESDILFMDEPTSHLDIETCEWLEEYLESYQGGLVVISHDRYFMDRVVKRVLELEEGVTRSFQGNYSAYTEKKDIEVERRLKEWDRNRIERDRQARIIETLKRRNKYSTEIKTREKLLDKTSLVKRPHEAAELGVKMESGNKHGKNVIMAKDLSVNRGERNIFSDVEVDLEVGDKLGIYGPNGAGKTTLIQALIGEIPSKGDLWISPGADMGYFAQGHETLDEGLTAEEQIMEALGKDEKLKVRRLLARFLLRGDCVERPISTLSGGERARVAMALLIARRRNLLILDEPTNYLDVASRQAVESALSEYPGTILVVTHDRYFLDNVCNKVGEIRDGRLKTFNGTYSQAKGKFESSHIAEAVAYRVISKFTDWNTNKKYKQGDRIVIAHEEKEKYEWALDAGKLKRIRGNEKKRISDGTL